MSMSSDFLGQYLTDIARIRRTGAGTGEISYYGCLASALNAIGTRLKPRVFCVPNLRNRGAGFPDMGLFAGADVGVKDEWPEGRPPDRGVVEIDDIPAPIEVKLRSEQVTRYLAQYGLVLVTNFREFVLLGRDAAGRREVREQFDFGCATADAFFALASGTSRPLALSSRFAEFLERVMLHQVSLARPEDVAFFLASYARDALARVAARADLPAFDALRQALEESLGLKFQDTQGEHLFRSTLVQTLFYGLFSAWVEVARAGLPFDWHAAGWNLHVPFIAELFHRIATPRQLRPLGLEEPLGWAAAALERIDRPVFFASFDQAEAVRYFYEPFLAAFDPELRKDFGVWYTPREIVQYMVERVDRVLRTELGIADGLADPSVWVLDPCCGTGAYLVAVLDRINRTLREKGEGALAAEDLKLAATTRIAGFEIMPAPYVIAHWQIGQALRTAGVPLAEGERAAVYLTNALTGWAAPEEIPATDQPQHGLRFAFPPLADELDASSRVKREKRILVVLGNPPYNAFAGTSPAEEAGLVEPYKECLQSEWGIRKFNLDDLYVRFFRVAERRIAEATGRGVVCFITNHSWLSYPSFVVMRKRMISEFDRMWIDNLNGSKYETGKVSPDGSPDPSVFSTESNREGIQVGTAVTLLVRTGRFLPPEVRYRDLWGTTKRRILYDSLVRTDFDAQYHHYVPGLGNRLSFKPGVSATDYSAWTALPALSELPPFSGALEMRVGRLMSLDRDELAARMRRYFDPQVSFEALQQTRTGPTEDMARFKSEVTRTKILREGAFSEQNIKVIALRPFDFRFAYHTNIRPLWNEPRPELAARVFNGNGFIVTRLRARRPEEGVPMAWTTALAGYHLLDPNSHPLPVFAAPERANLSPAARSWLRNLGVPDPETDPATAALPWHHAMAIGYSPAWLDDNGDDIRQDWPRIPLPDNALLLRASAAIGARVTALLDPETPVPGVTAGTINSALALIAVPSTQGGRAMSEHDRAVTAGWGHSGRGEAVMPGRGKLVERDYAPDEAAAAINSDTLGERTFDVFLNDSAYWRNVPAAVWNFSIGGYQVLKKFLSYREVSLLGRPLTPAEIRYVRDVARRLAALRLMGPELDANYRSCAAAHYQLASRTQGVESGSSS
jgi:hypothetical protein